MRSLLFIIFCPLLLISQEQVSNVYYDEILDPVYFNGIAGFAEIADDKYFLLDRDSLMIFKIEGDDISLAHTITEGPSINYKVPLRHNNHISRLAIVEEKYFRFFRDIIQVVDIPSGIIISQFDLSSTDYSLYRPLKLFGDYLFFRGFGVDSERLILRYNWKTHDLAAMPGFFVDYGYDNFIDEKIYFDVPDQNMIMSIDGLTDEVDTVYNYSSNLEIFQAHTSIEAEYIIIKDDSGIYVVDGSFELRSLECIGDFDGDFKTVHIRDEKLFLSKWDPVKLVDLLVIIDMTTCDTLQSFELEGVIDENKLTFYDNHEKDFTMFSYNGNIYGDTGVIYMLDHKSGTLGSTGLGLNPLNSSMLINDHSIYFLNYFTGDLAPAWINIVKYDKQTQYFKHLLPYDAISNSTVLGYLNDEDELFFIANTLEYDPRIWKVDEEEFFTPISTMDYRKNHGVGYRSKVIADNDNVISLGIGGLMITEENTKHIHAERMYSDLMVTEDGYGALFDQNDSIYVISCNKEGENIEIENLSDSHLDYSSLSEDGFLFNYRHSQYSSLYYNLNDRSEKHLIYDNETLSVRRMAAGEDFMLFNGYANQTGGNSKYYLFKNEDQSVIRLDEAIESYLMYTADNNNFYLVDTDYANNNTKIQRYHPQQGFEMIYDGEGTRNGYITGVKKSNDEIVVIEIKLDDKVRVLIDNGTTTYTYDFDHGTSNFNSFVKAKSSNSIIFNTALDGIHESYYWEFGKDPVLIDTGLNSNLIASHIDGDLAILFFSKGFGIGYEVYIYNTSTNTVSESIELENSNGWNGLDSERIITVESGRSYLFSYNDEQVGYEPWILDIETKNAELLADLVEGNASSSPSDFINTNGFVYFTAVTNDDSRQWFRIESDIIDGVKQVFVKSMTPIKIFPNPTTDYIELSEDYDSIKIYSSNGKLVKSLMNYKSGDKIRTTDLSDAIYFIQSKSKNGVYSTLSFTKTN